MRHLLILALASASAGAQSAPPSPIRWDITAGSGDGAISASLAAVKFVRVARDRVQLGVGLRGTYVGGDLKLTPAGAENVPVGVIDTLSVSSSALMLNVSGGVSLVLSSRLLAGMNIDLAGFGAGPS